MRENCRKGLGYAKYWKERLGLIGWIPLTKDETTLRLIRVGDVVVDGVKLSEYEVTYLDESFG